MPAMTVAQLTHHLAPHRIAARHRRVAAIHEAGHAVAARWRDVGAMSLIWPSGSDGQTIKTWLGQTLSEKTTAANSRLISVAGPVAEYIWHGCDGNIHEQWFWDEQCAMSETDWQMARTKPGEPDQKFMDAVRHVHRQFTGPLWPDVCCAARELIVRSRSLRRGEIAELQAIQCRPPFPAIRR
ncbi:MAG: hypothetical protein JWO19_5867 [Bryobacterales bacterium]|nr:hypothetical protein [Bryobacterales bacterium]